MTSLARYVHALNNSAIKLIRSEEINRKRREEKSQFQILPLYGKQAEIIADPARFTITEGSTKSGKTFSHIEWLLFEAFRWEYGNHWWVAPSIAQAKIAFRRAQDRLRGYILSRNKKLKIADPIQYEVNLSERYIKLGDSYIWFKTAENDNYLYGDDVYTIVGDEFTRWKEASWIACYTTLTATKGKGKFIGNVRGRDNFAFRLARRAEKEKQSGEQTEWSYYKLTAEDAIAGGVIDPAILEQARKDFTEGGNEELFLELYYAKPSQTGSNPFGFQAIEDCCIASPTGNHVICWGIDLAKKHDWTVLIGLDANGGVAEYHRFQKSWRETKQDIIRIIGDTPTAIDSTGAGDPVTEDIQAECSQVEGVIFTSSPKSKQQFMELLTVDFQARAFTIPRGVIELEAISFEKIYTPTGIKYSAPEGEHDDCISALALARKKYREIKHLLQVNVIAIHKSATKIIRPEID